MKYIIGILLVTLLCAASVTGSLNRSSSQVVVTCTGEDCFSQAQNFIVNHYKDGYKVTWISTIGSHYTSDDKVIVIMEK